MELEETWVLGDTSESGLLAAVTAGEDDVFTLRAVFSAMAG